MRALPLALVCSSLLGVTPVRAEEAADAARAKSLFVEGRALIDEGRYPEACSRFEASLKLVSGIGTMFNLADCWEKIGRTGSALAMFRRVAATAKAIDQDERARVAAERAAALEPKVTKLRITVAASPKVEVKRNEQVVATEDLDEPVPVDPGTYRIAASSPGKKSWASELEVPNQGGVIAVTVPPLQDLGHAAVVQEPSAPAEAEAPPSPPEPELPGTPPALDEGRSSPALRRLALVFGGIGAGAMTAGVAFALQYQSSNDDAEAVCPGSRGCTREEVERHAGFVNDARRARTLSYLGFGLGTAALTSAGILYFWKTQPVANVEASARLLPDGSWSAAIGGKF